MILKLLFSSLIASVYSVKTWIPNKNIDDKFNWDLLRIPQRCDNVLLFPVRDDVTLFWTFSEIFLTGLSLPTDGNVIFSFDAHLIFAENKECPRGSDITFTKTEIDGWLNPDNWRSHSGSTWLPHVERIPCAGETIVFPPGKSLSVQLPAVMSPIGKIIFDNKEFYGETWPNFLNTEEGYDFFKGNNDMKQLQWRSDPGCYNKKKCACARSPYVIRDMSYVDVPVTTLENAVCLYARRDCKTPRCYSPVKLEGHCCEICGSEITLKDKTEDGLDIDAISEKVQAEWSKSSNSDKVSVHTRRKNDGDIQIIIIANDDSDTIAALALATSLMEKLLESHLKTAISSKNSGLTLSNYVSNGTGIVLGTLCMVVLLFASIFYIYIIHPKKKQTGVIGIRPFMFARFENTLHDASSEENLEIGSEVVTTNISSQAFDNPMFAASKSTSDSERRVHMDPDYEENQKESKAEDYGKFVYSKLENADDELDVFEEKPVDETEARTMDIFNEIKL